MKKVFVLILSLMTLYAATALAETIDITFDGSYVEFEEFGFKVYLPNEWYIGVAEFYFSAHNENETQYMAIDVLEAEGMTLMEIAEEFASSEDFENLVAVSINGIDFVLFEASEIGAFGAFVNTENNAYCIQFYFAPYGDEALTALATQIMASVDTI